MRDLGPVEDVLRGAVPGRDVAAARLRATGFPGRKDEAWYYSPARRWYDVGFGGTGGASPALDRLPDGDRLVFVDGRLRADLSTAAARSLAEADAGCVLSEVEGFTAANAACWRDGADVVLADGAVLHVVHVATGGAAFPRLRLRIPAGAAQVTEQFIGEGASALVAAVTEIEVAAGARVDHVLLQALPAAARLVVTAAARVHAGGAYAVRSVQTGDGLARVEVDVELAGEGASADLRALALGRHAAHADHHVTVRHRVPRCTSRQDIRAILDGGARSVFTGRVIVAEGAAGSDSAQSSRSLLLSDDAVANVRPQLEIYADEVACAHGATVGQLDDAALFYLQQRGLSAEQARALLVDAFAAEVVDAVPEAVRGLAADAVQRWLASR